MLSSSSPRFTFAGPGAARPANDAPHCRLHGAGHECETVTSAVFLAARTVTSEWADIALIVEACTASRCAAGTCALWTAAVREHVRRLPMRDGNG